MLGHADGRCCVRACGGGGYYTDGRYLYQVVQIGNGKAGPVVLRDCVSDEVYGVRIGEFRARYWLVREGARSI